MGQGSSGMRVLEAYNQKKAGERIFYDQLLQVQGKMRVTFLHLMADLEGNGILESMTHGGERNSSL